MSAGKRQHTEAQDLQAVLSAKGGNRFAFEGIVRRYTPVLYSLAVRLLGTGEEAEDAVQEIFEKAYRNLGRFHSTRRFFPWLYTIAVNHLRSRMRKNRRLRRLGIDPVSPELIEEHQSSRDGDPQRQAVLREGELLARQALDKLRRVQREVFVLRQLQGLSTAETAEILHIPEGSVKTHLRRARLALVDALTDQGWE